MHGFSVGILEILCLKVHTRGHREERGIPLAQIKDKSIIPTGGYLYDGTPRCDLLGSIVVVRLDPLELDVDKVFGVQRTGQDLVWLDLFWFTFVVILVKKVSTQSAADGQKESRPRRLFGRGCFCGVPPGLRS